MTRKQTVLTIIGIALLILILFALWGVKEFFTFKWIFSLITDKVIAETGVDIWIARAIAGFVGLLLTYAIFLMLSWGKSRSVKVSIGLALLSVIVIGFSITMYQMTKDQMFKPDGTPAKCYTRLSDGEIVFADCNWKVHKTFGTPVLPVTEDVIRQYQVQQKGIPKMTPLTPSQDMRFFSYDGKPLVWYYQHSDGRIEFFGSPGRHPQLNTVLAPVDSQIVSQYLQYREKGNNDMVILSSDNALKGLRDDLDSWKPKVRQK